MKYPPIPARNTLADWRSMPGAVMRLTTARRSCKRATSVEDAVAAFSASLARASAFSSRYSRWRATCACHTIGDLLLVRAPVARRCIRRRVRHRTDPLDGPSRRLVRARRDDDSRDTVRRSWDCPCGGGRRLYPDHRRALLHIRLSAPLRGANRPDSPRRVCARSLRSAEPLLDRRRPSVHLCSVGEPPRRLSGTSRAHGVPRRLVLEGVL